MPAGHCHAELGPGNKAKAANTLLPRDEEVSLPTSAQGQVSSTAPGAERNAQTSTPCLMEQASTIRQGSKSFYVSHYHLCSPTCVDTWVQGIIQHSKYSQLALLNHQSDAADAFFIFPLTCSFIPRQHRAAVLYLGQCPGQGTAGHFGKKCYTKCMFKWQPLIWQQMPANSHWALSDYGTSSQWCCTHQCYKPVDRIYSKINLKKQPPKKNIPPPPPKKRKKAELVVYFTTLREKEET